MRISQSFLKDFYKSTCGGVLHAKYIDHNYPDTTTPSQNAGKFFEYLATGYIRKGDEPPQAEYYKINGNGYNKGDMKPEYLQAAKHAELFKKVLSTNFQKPYQFGDSIKFGEVSGITDVIAYDQLAKPCIIDLKYSGMLYDRWQEYGWGIEKFTYAAERLQVDDMLTVLKQVQLLWQPLVYTWIAFKSSGVYPRWFFYIADQKSDDVIFRELVFSPVTLASFDALMPQIISEVELLLNTGGFVYRASYSNCFDCHLTDCRQRVTLPNIQTVTI